MISVPLDTTTPDEPTIADIEFWQAIGAFFVQAGWNLLAVAGIIVGAVLVVWILRFVIHRVVGRIVNGAKNKANVDDTQALERSPLASVRLVQRTRTLGSILGNIVNVTVVIIALLLIINVLAPTALGSLTLLTCLLYTSPSPRDS